MTTRKTIASLALAFALALPVVATAGEEKAAVEKPSFSATHSVQIETIVEAIDYETRMVTLKGPQGNLRTVEAKNTPNLEEVEVGDQVNVEIVENVTVEVFAAEEGIEPGQGVMAAKAVNTPEEAPGGMEMVTTVTTAIVEEINIEANTFKLKLPGDEIREFVAVVPENLKKAAVGDLVVITVTEAIAAYLVEIPSE